MSVRAVGRSAAMLLTGSRTLEDLRRGVLWPEPAFTTAVEALQAADIA